MAIVGVGRWGAKNHVAAWLERDDTEITWICDVDEDIGREQVERVADEIGHRPRFTRDMRRAFDDASLDVVVVATPHHWHALAGVWAMQAGKDVYLEKPVSHDLREGHSLIAAARKYGRICQTGTQQRSLGSLRAAARYIREGKLGEVRLAHCISYNRRRPIGPPRRTHAPRSVDYNLWCGPAPRNPITRRQFHYDWHWFWDYGNGGIGNNGIHRVDAARFALGLRDVGRAVLSYGGRFGPPDAGETPNTQVAVHLYDECLLVQEVRGLPTDPYFDCTMGVVFVGTEGIVVYDKPKATLLDLEGDVVSRFQAEDDDHIGNFLEAVRSRRAGLLRSDVREGHVSSALCHLANVSYRLGRRAADSEIRDAVRRAGPAADGLGTLRRTLRHLKEEGIDLHASPLVLGRLLRIDPDQESIVGDPEADALLDGKHRAPFVLPPPDRV